jgi:hypothetical protein
MTFIFFFYLELEVILLKVVAVGTSTLSKLFTAEVVKLRVSTRNLFRVQNV